MSEAARLRRPPAGASLEETRAYFAELAETLERIGVKHGSEFIVAAAGVADVSNGKLGPFVRSSATSRAGAIANYPRSGTQRRRVLESIMLSGERGMTREELCDRLHMQGSSLHPRVWELVNGGYIEASGRTRATHAGVDAEVLVPTPKAFDAPEEAPS